MNRPWLLLVAACAMVALAVGLVVSSAQRPPDLALTHVSVRDGLVTALDALRLRCGVGIRAAAHGNAAVDAGSAHQHDVDPVSAALLAIDGVVALAVVVLLLRRPPPQPPRPPS